MTCVRVDGAIFTIADVSEPFYMHGRLWAMDKLWGPYPCKANGDPYSAKVPDYHYQDAFERWRRLFPEQAMDWGKGQPQRLDAKPPTLVTK